MLYFNYFPLRPPNRPPPPPSTYIPPVTTRRPTPAPTCAPGQIKSGNQCITITQKPSCPEGFKALPNGQCQKLCPSNTIQRPDGTCEPPGGYQYPQPDEPLTYPTPVTTTRPTRPSTAYIPPVTTARPTRPPTTYLPPPTTYLPPPTCQPGFTLQNGRCQKVCPPGTKLTPNGNCQKQCPPGTELQPDGSCRKEEGYAYPTPENPLVYPTPEPVTRPPTTYLP